MTLYRIEELFNERWSVVGSHIATAEEARIMAHHECDGEPMRVVPEREGAYTLEEYAGDNAQKLREAWKKAGKPKYNQED